MQSYLNFTYCFFNPPPLFIQTSAYQIFKIFSKPILPLFRPPPFIRHYKVFLLTFDAKSFLSGTSGSVRMAVIIYEIQWHLYKADIIGTIKQCLLYESVRFTAITFYRIWPDNCKIRAISLTALQKVSALLCVCLRGIPLQIHKCLTIQLFENRLPPYNEK